MRLITPLPPRGRCRACPAPESGRRSARSGHGCGAAPSCRRPDADQPHRGLRAGCIDRRRHACGHARASGRPRKKPITWPGASAGRAMPAQPAQPVCCRQLQPGALAGGAAMPESGFVVETERQVEAHLTSIRTLPPQDAQLRHPGHDEDEAPCRQCAGAGAARRAVLALMPDTGHEDGGLSSDGHRRVSTNAAAQADCRPGPAARDSRRHSGSARSTFSSRGRRSTGGLARRRRKVHHR